MKIESKSRISYRSRIMLNGLFILFLTSLGLFQESKNILAQGNFCNGGLDRGMLIVSEARITNYFKQTIFESCESTGGRAVIMPDLPDPKRKDARLV